MGRSRGLQGAEPLYSAPCPVMVYDSEEDEEAKLVGEGPAIHHFGIEVDDRRKFIEKIGRASCRERV